MTGPSHLHCGTVPIGSSKPLPLAGYGSRMQSARSDTAGLEANWVMFGSEDRLHLLVAVDALFSSDLFECEVRKQLETQGIEVACIMVVASHTHYAPNIDPLKPRLGHADPGYVAEIAGRLARSIESSLTSSPGLVPEIWSWGETRNPGSVYRRATRLQLSARSWPPVRIATQIAPNPKVRIDQNLRLWIARTAEGLPLFAVVTWPCHATSRADATTASPDFIAPLREALRSRTLDELPIMFLPGASGDIRPGFWRQKSLKKWLYPYPFQRTFCPPSAKEEVEFDSSIKVTVERILAAPMTEQGFSLSSLSQTQFPLADLMDEADDRQIPVYRAVLGGLEIIGFGAEMSAGWVAKLALANDPQRQILSGCVGPVFGYLPTEEQVPEGGYEVEGFRRGFGISGRFRPGKNMKQVLAEALSRTGHATARPEQ